MSSTLNPFYAHKNHLIGCRAGSFHIHNCKVSESIGLDKASQLVFLSLWSLGKKKRAGAGRVPVILSNFAPSNNV